MSNQELTKIQSESLPTIEVARSISIKNEKDMESATVLLSCINSYKQKVEEEKKKVTAPLLQALKAERERWAPIEELFDEAISTIRSRMSSYQTDMLKKAKLEEEKIALRTGEGRGKLSIETAVKKINQIARPEEKVETSFGSVSFRTQRILVVTDEKQIPREFLIVDEAKLLKHITAGNTVPGAHVDEIKVPINRRK